MLSRRNFLKVGGLSIGAYGYVLSHFSHAATRARSTLENMVRDVKPLGPKDYAGRLENAQKLMAAHRIDGLLLTGSTDLLYFTNVQWGTSERTFAAVLNREGNPVWVCPAFELERAHEQVPGDHQIRTWEEHESPFRIIGGILKDLGGRRLALGPTVRSFVSYGIKTDAPELELVDGAVVTENCRVIKTEKEVAFMELASKITKLALKETFSQLREGMSAADIMAIARDAHQKMGVAGYGNPKIGKNSAFPHGSKVERRLQDRAIVLISGGSSVEGFHCDVDRTSVFGKPSDKQRRIFDIIKRAQDEALEKVRPGVTCEEVEAVARGVIVDAGYGPDYKYFQHRLGHGVGMDGHEYTYLVRGNNVALQPGMTFSCEPAIYIQGEFGIRIEDDFVVTEDGGRFLGGMRALSLEKPLGD